MAQKNPKFVIGIAYINGDGEVVRFVRADRTDFENGDYYETEKRRIPMGAVLVTENYCRWRLFDGQWQ